MRAAEKAREEVIGGATFDPSGVYRYSLTRRWGAEREQRILFVMLNPSTADADNPDPTITRCIGFAKAWGYGGLEVCNIFAFRSTHPTDLLGIDDPVGPENDTHIGAAVDSAALVVLAHGTHSKRRLREMIRSRAWTVRAMVAARGKMAMCLGVTKDRMPLHPLYLSASLLPQPLSLWCAA